MKTALVTVIDNKVAFFCSGSYAASIAEWQGEKKAGIYTLEVADGSYAELTLGTGPLMFDNAVEMFNWMHCR